MLLTAYKRHPITHNMASPSATPSLKGSSSETTSVASNPTEQSVTFENIEPGHISARPTHFLNRGNGQFTPLVAIDELPPHVAIVGLPATVALEQVAALCGIAIGPAMNKAHHSYAVLVENENAKAGGDAPLTPEKESEKEDEKMVPSSAAINTRLDRALDGVGADTDPEELKQIILKLKVQKGATSSGQRYNPTTPGVLGQKVYCTHWMRTGECDFTQQGCMFLHSMPDLDTLDLLGFRSYPRWFREMPRKYQVENAKDFNPNGLGQQQGQQSQQSPYYQQQNDLHNFNNRDRRRGYTNRGSPMTRTVYPYPPPPSPSMTAAGFATPGHSWQNGMSSPYHGTPGQTPAQPYNSGLFSRPYSPANSAIYSPQQFDGAGYGHPSIWSRATTPNIKLVNTLHKPLTPMVAPNFNNTSADTYGRLQSATPTPDLTGFPAALPAMDTRSVTSNKGRGSQASSTKQSNAKGRGNGKGRGQKPQNTNTKTSRPGSTHPAGPVTHGVRLNQAAVTVVADESSAGSGEA